MNTFNSVLLLSFCASILLSCTKKSDNLIICNQSIPPTYFIFNVVESSTGQDLFFSATPALGLKEMYFFKTKDVSRKDTIRPTIEGTGTARNFKLLLDKMNKLLNYPKLMATHQIQQKLDILTSLTTTYKDSKKATKI